MNKKEISEIKRRLRSNKNNAKTIWGCYVNQDGSIIANMTESISMLSEEETAKYLDIFRNALSGKPGKNLFELSFSHEQEGSKEYQQIFKIWKSKAKDEAAIRALFASIINKISMEDRYVILLTMDEYDVPAKKDNGNDDFDSDETFTYILCAICPVGSGKAELGYVHEEKRFLDASIHQIIDKPSSGFMFPSFNDRCTDIHHAQIFCKQDENLDNVIQSVFGEAAQVPKTSKEQKESFNAILTNSLGDDCTFDVVQMMHEAFSEKILNQRELKDPAPAMITSEDIGTILRNAGIKKVITDQLEDQLNDSLSEDGISPYEGIPVESITEAEKLVVETKGVSIIAKDDAAHTIRTEMIRGREVIVIEINEYCRINGVELATK